MFARSILRTATKAYVNHAMFSTRVLGRVKFFNSEKGFGFITPADGTPDVFVHWSGVKSDGFKGLKDDEEVEFEVAEGSNGKSNAVEVTGVDGALLECQKPRQQGNSREGRGRDTRQRRDEDY